jgi:hypothetical protein
MLLLGGSIARAAREAGESPVTVRAEGAHLELLSQAEGVALMHLGWGWLVAALSDLAEQVESVSLMSAFLVVEGEPESLLGRLCGVSDTVRQQVRLPHVGDPQRVPSDELHFSTLFDRFLK